MIYEMKAKLRDGFYRYSCNSCRLHPKSPCDLTHLILVMDGRALPLDGWHMTNFVQAKRYYYEMGEAKTWTLVK